MAETDLAVLPQLIADAAEPLPDIDDRTFGEFFDRFADARVVLLGDRAWMRNRVEVTVTPPTGEPVKRSGYTLTILRKGGDGRWRIARDANLMLPGGG